MAERNTHPTGYWNYRLIRFTGASGTWYAVHEVYYDKAGLVINWTARPATVGSETARGARVVYGQFAEALARPTLTELDMMAGTARDTTKEAKHAIP